MYDCAIRIYPNYDEACVNKGEISTFYLMQLSCMIELLK